MRNELVVIMWLQLSLFFSCCCSSMGMEVQRKFPVIFVILFRSVLLCMSVFYQHTNIYVRTYVFVCVHCIYFIQLIMYFVGSLFLVVSGFPSLRFDGGRKSIVRIIGMQFVCMHIVLCVLYFDVAEVYKADMVTDKRNKDVMADLCGQKIFFIMKCVEGVCEFLRVCLCVYLFIFLLLFILYCFGIAKFEIKVCEKEKLETQLESFGLRVRQRGGFFALKISQISKIKTQNITISLLFRIVIFLVLAGEKKKAFVKFGIFKIQQQNDGKYLYFILIYFNLQKYFIIINEAKAGDGNIYSSSLCAMLNKNIIFKSLENVFFFLVIIRITLFFLKHYLSVIIFQIHIFKNVLYRQFQFTENIWSLRTSLLSVFFILIFYCQIFFNQYVQISVRKLLISNFLFCFSFRFQRKSYTYKIFRCQIKKMKYFCKVITRIKLVKKSSHFICWLRICLIVYFVISIVTFF
eukprot:TRINITY_DN12123_c0_g1_i2.p1 TRINITY_DN12123_c0_g1~~TRINITY_DN12123_c0_g1_i2.p1  ORF type:complete len:462 (-),score=-10.72 TRINITY_DN12123_c0_g1_i2:3676-5061(-)